MSDEECGTSDERRMPTRTPARRRRTATVGAIATVAAVFALAGCSLFGVVGTGPAPDGPDAVTAERVDCHSDSWMPIPPGSLESTQPPIPEPGRVPDGFEPVAALRCTQSFYRYDDVPPADGSEAPDGELLRLVVGIERFEGDLGPLLSALDEPDDAADSLTVCSADMQLVPPLWLEASDGNVIHVHQPRDACGKTKDRVNEALGTLDLVSVAEVETIG
ncbi:hypothetical protein [Agromyces sp. LHK192]|uniref:hypothetical protein n=1 Tax=Agromyces sp. LHK192 TaxID=2498704 RepID=UPI000FD7BFF5|nr:hypothetical protein [Agromyces sp. LHK192]